jgi:rubrerythrin
LIDLNLLKEIKIVKVEERSEDAWYDFSLRQLRKGEVRFYRVKDFLTGEWLFKLCIDGELGKALVKAAKCPPGARFAQLEGNTMVFQKSQDESLYYDIISLAHADENDKVSRKVVSHMEDVPAIIRENFQIQTYEEATGRRAPGKHLVTLTKANDEKTMITLFLLERAWPLSPITLEEGLKKHEEQKRIKMLSKKATKRIDTGHVWKCPICGSEFTFIHVETEARCGHKLEKRKLE